MIDAIRNSLFDMQDKAYRDFHSRLVPNIDKNTIVGVRTPLLRKYAKKLSRQKDICLFLNDIPHKYYEEYNIHGFIIQDIKDFDECIKMLEKFLPYIDNWATCDMLRPGVFKNNTERLYHYILKWIKSDKPYTVRFAIGMLNSYYLDEYFKKEHLELVSCVKSQDYYVKMMISWYFSTALAKQYDAAISFIEGNALDKWTHNKAIQKAVESFRITDEKKMYLKTLKK